MFSSWTGAVTSSPYHFWLTLASGENPPNWFDNLDDEQDFVFDPGFSSNHPGITMMCFADGAIAAIPDTIQQDLFFNLSTASGREVAGNGDWD